nr:uncharacterized protein LOC116651461 isoform X1 [Drosophila virilis]
MHSSLASLVGAAAPTEDLREELARSARNTKKLIRQDSVNFCLSLAQLIVSCEVANQEEITKWNDFIEQWTPRVATLPTDDNGIKQFSSQVRNLLPKGNGSQQVTEQLNLYTKGAYDNMNASFMKGNAQRYTTFESEAREIIRRSRAATGRAEYFTVYFFNRFANAVQKSREFHFHNFFQYLTLTGEDYHDWLAMQIMIM